MKVSNTKVMNLRSLEVAKAPSKVLITELITRNVLFILIAVIFLENLALLVKVVR